MWIFEHARIKIARESRDMTQADLAGKLGIPTQQLSQWETGAVNPGQESLLNICNALNVHPKFFYVQRVPNVHDESEQGKNGEAA